MAQIEAVVMPKWGLAMQEGMLAAWHVEEGEEVERGEEIADIETSKIANVFESPVEGVLRRRVAAEGETLPVGALLAVVAPAEVDDAAIDAFVSDFQARFAAEGPSGEAPPEPAFIEAGGRRIRYLAMGEEKGTPVLLVHGFGGDLNNWLFNQEELAEDHWTLAIDLPGHGGSAKEVGEGDVGSLAASVLAFMDAKGIGRAHLVGHSLGGAICLYLAINHPDRVATLSAIAPAGLGPDIAMDYIDGFIANNRAKKLRPVLEMLVHDPSLVTAEMVEDILKYKRLDGVEAALNTVAQACFAGGRQSLEFEAGLEELRCPAQVIWGRHDRILPASHAQDLPDTLEAHLLEDAGHLVHMERAREVNALIGAMLRR